MRKIKKMMALVIASVMTVSTISAFAATGDFSSTPESSIEVSDLVAGDGAKYIQLLKEDPNVTGGWNWADGIASLVVAGATADDPSTLGGLTIANITDGITDAEAAAIANAVKTGSFTNMTVTGTTASASDLAPGLYYVAVTPGETNDYIYNPIFVGADYYEGGNTISASSSYTNRVIAKKQPIDVEKDMDDEKQVDVHVGDVVAFTITTNIPSFTDAYENKTFKIQDTLQTGLEFKEITSFTVAGYSPVKDQDYTFDSSTSGFTYEFLDEGTDGFLDTVLGNPLVTIKYTATVTSTADFNVTEMDNEVKLTYTHSYTTEDDEKDITDKTRHYTFSIDAGLLGTTGQSLQEHTEDLVKVGVDANNNPIYTSNSTERVVDESTTVAALANATFKFEAAEGDCLDNGFETINPVTTNAAGELVIKGLDAGVYKLTELTAPAGFIIDTTPHYVAIIPHYADDEDGVKYLVSYDIGWGDTIAAAKTSLVKSYTMQNDGEHTVTKIEKSNITGSDTQIKNTRGLQLPSTGGMGTTLFYIIGAVLVLGAGILLVTRRRMSAN